jgi:ribosomal protein L37AE/L43A
MQELDKIAALVHKGTPCPKCGHKEHTISNPSHPTINQCTKCKHQWNPDNERFKKSGVVVAQELVRIAKSLLANEKLIATNKTWHSWEYDYNDNLASIFMRDDGSLRMTIVSTQRKSGLGAGTWTTPQEDISIGTITNVDWATIRRTLSKYNKKADRATAPFSRAWDVPNTNRSMMLEEIIEKMQGGGVVDEKPDLHTPEVERALKSGIEAYKVDIERIKDSNGNTALKVTMFMPYDVDKFMIDFKWTKRPIRDMLSVSLFLSNDNYGGMRLRFDKYSTVYSWIRGRRPPSGRVYGIKDAINYINKHYVLRGSPYILSQPR